MTRDSINVEISTDPESTAMRIELWREDGRALLPQEVLDAVADALLYYEFEGPHSSGSEVLN